MIRNVLAIRADGVTDNVDYSRQDNANFKPPAHGNLTSNE